MSRKDGVLLASRALALILTMWALGELSYLPVHLYSFLHYIQDESILVTSPRTQYLRHYYLIDLGFLIIRIAGFALTARWLYRKGPEIDELFLPSASEASQS
jgi:hypothetical protein